MDEYSDRIRETLLKFQPITLEEMDAVRLMNRLDTKYLFHMAQLLELLEEAAEFYRVLSIDERRIFRYNSLYLDTPQLKSYLDHHNGIRPRYKVRFREYEDTGSFFLEVKSKISKERTRKSRTEAERIEEALSDRSMAYIQQHYPIEAKNLGPALWTNFRRITLVGIEFPERITIDIDLTFRHLQEEKALPFAAICEVKRDHSRGSTPFMKILKSSRIYPAPISKYCLGTILLNKAVKYNRFKINLLTLNKLEHVYRSDPASG
jgi:hypothetical protein